MVQAISQNLFAAVERQAQVSQSLLAHAALRAQREAQEDERTRRANLRRRLSQETRKRVRVQQAMVTIGRLRLLGASEQFQQLLAVRGRPIVVWGGSEITPPLPDGPSAWRYKNYIALSKTAVCLRNSVEVDRGGTFELHPDCSKHIVDIPYHLDDEHLCACRLEPIATSSPLINYDDEEDCRMLEFRDHYSTHMMFDVLVVQSDPAKFDSLIRRAIGSS